ncbi:MAG: acyltransferase [bacterium]
MNDFPKKTVFLPRLEALRGLAALAVAFYHSYRIIPATGNQALVIRGLSNIVYGPGGVFFFYILSGLVLGMSIRRYSVIGGSEYFDFMLRRIRRLYPALIVTTLAYTLYWLVFIPEHSPVTDAFSSAPPAITLLSVVRNILLLNVSINAVTWSLQVEMICSLMLPILHFATRHSSFLQGVVFCFFSTVYFAYRFTNCSVGTNTLLCYLFMFYLGYIIVNLEAVMRRITRFHRWMPAAIFVCASFVCCTTPHFGNNLFLFSIGASAIISLITFNYQLPPFQFLDLPIVRYYGKISYSFYLLHPLSMAIVGRACLRLIPNNYLAQSPILSGLGIFVFSVALATPIAYLCYTYVEMPFLRSTTTASG